jgi:hypothetical protein
MEPNPANRSKPRSFSAESPFSLIGILIAALLGIILGGLIAGYLL